MTADEDMARLPTKPEVQRERELDRLGREIDKLRDEMRQTVVEQSAEIGKRLIAAKRIAGHGRWLPWLREREMSGRAAQRDMQVARNLMESEHVNPTHVSDLTKMSFRNALAAIQEPKDRGPSTSPRMRGVDIALPSDDAFERARVHLGEVEQEAEQKARPDLATAVRDLDRILAEGVQVAAWLGALPKTTRHDLRRRVEGLMVKLDDVQDLLLSSAKNAAQEAEAEPAADDATERPAAEQDASPADPDAELRQRLVDRLADRMGSTGMATVAAQIGVGASTLNTFLRGGKVYAKTRKAIEAYLTR
jgi:Protein of unknown function (DUF3102)